MQKKTIPKSNSKAVLNTPYEVNDLVYCYWEPTSTWLKATILKASEAKDEYKVLWCDSSTSITSSKHLAREYPEEDYSPKSPLKISPKSPLKNSPKSLLKNSPKKDASYIKSNQSRLKESAKDKVSKLLTARDKELKALPVSGIGTEDPNISEDQKNLNTTLDKILNARDAKKNLSTEERNKMVERKKLGNAAQLVGLDSARKSYLLGEKRSRQDLGSDDDTSGESPVIKKEKRTQQSLSQSLGDTLLKLQEGDKEMMEKKITAKNHLKEKELALREKEMRDKNARKDKQLELELEREKSRRFELELALMKEKNKSSSTSKYS
jgi:hypothetical protein